jgi:YHS domain-containing protein
MRAPDFRHPLFNSLAALVVAASLNASAGEFNESEGVAIQGFDPVAYVTELTGSKGSTDFTSVYKGSVFHFKNAANRDAFTANPEKFAPQYHGYCAFGVSRGYKAATSPDAFTVVDGKLYLNYNAEVKTMWAKDVPGFIGKADSQWAVVEKTTKVLR